MRSRSGVLRALALTLLALAACATAASAATAARARTGKYKGKTSQHLTIKLTVKSKGTRVDFAVPYAKETQCTGNSTYVAGNTDLGKNVTLHSDGTFKFTYASEQNVTINGQPGAKDRYTYTVTGKFVKNTVTGTFSERDDIYDSSNNLYGSCQTTGVTYKAKRQLPK
jgi:outer membrane lipoprotein-sorting protein